MNTIPPVTSSPPPLAPPAATAVSGPGLAPSGARPASPDRPPEASRRQALLRHLPPPNPALSRLARLLNVDTDALDRLLPAVAWGKHLATGTYALRYREEDRVHPLQLDALDTVTEFPEALIENDKDDSPEAQAAREVDRLMTEVAAPCARALLLDGVKPVAIGDDTFHLTVTPLDDLRARTILDDSTSLPLVWQPDRACYAPAAELASRPASPARDTADAPGAVEKNMLDLPLFGLEPGSEAAVFIMQEPSGDDVHDALAQPMDKGKRPAPDSPPAQTGGYKRPRLDPAGVGAGAWWNAWPERAGAPDFAQLAPDDRLRLQAAAVSAPTAMEYRQRDWQARRDGRPLPPEAIVQAHREACLLRIARRIATPTSYADPGLMRPEARQALHNLMAQGDATAVALYEALRTVWSASTDNIKRDLALFDRFLANRGTTLLAALKSFPAFAEQLEGYRAAVRVDRSAQKLFRAATTLRDLYFTTPFRQRVEARIAQPGSAFHAKSENIQAQYLTMAGHVDAWLARHGHAPAVIPDDVEGLRPFLPLLRACRRDGEKNASLKACLSLWRQECYPLYLDAQLDAATGQYPGEKTTRDKLRQYPRELAEYAWCHPIPDGDYLPWVKSLASNLRALGKVAEWTGLHDAELRSLVNIVRTAG